MPLEAKERALVSGGRVVDRLVCYDDIATHRLERCTLCSGPRTRVEVEVWADMGVVATVLLCQPCHAADPLREHVRRLMQARYDPKRWERAQKETNDAHTP
jgi:hypothetical protein